MDSIDIAAARDASGRFLPGTSGNPAGKAPGTRNRKTVLAAALRDGEDHGIARVVIDKALSGDAVTARFLLGLMVPKPRGREIALDLPEDARAGDVVAAFDATLAAMAAGEITPDEALIVTRVLDGKRRALETLALERRLAGEGAPRSEPETTAPAAAAPLHSACIWPSPEETRNVSATLPRAQRRRIAAMVRQHRGPTFAAARQG